MFFRRTQMPDGTFKIEEIQPPADPNVIDGEGLVKVVRTDPGSISKEDESKITMFHPRMGWISVNHHRYLRADDEKDSEPQPESKVDEQP